MRRRRLCLKAEDSPPSSTRVPQSTRHGRGSHGGGQPPLEPCRGGKGHGAMTLEERGHGRSGRGERRAMAAAKKWAAGGAGSGVERSGEPSQCQLFLENLIVRHFLEICDES
ncbi:hypothetical protein ZWY2020_030140 [Hordeum vulgare]|nr:hypothetical protein ZWY2020_030140 [Hordeum vulgare]